MVPTVAPPHDPARVLAAVEGLAPTLAERAAEIERARRVPPDLLERLRESGCFRLTSPTDYAGVGADLVSALAVWEGLARADASTAWVVAIGSAAWIDLAPLPRASFEALFVGGPDVIVAGAFSPSGTIVRHGDGYRVDGRWAFVSGCQHATWIYVNCLEDLGDGDPHFRIAVLAPDEVTIEDTWHVAGLCGTGSHHVRVEGVTVPASRTLVPFRDEPCVDDPFARLPIAGTFALAIAAVALGIAHGSLDDAAALAPVKTPLLAAGPLSASPTFHDAIARATTELAAARLLLDHSATLAWSAAVQGRPMELDERARLRAAATWTVERASAAVETAYRFGGGGAVYAASPLQRRLRDIQALRQHFLIRPDTFGAAGAALLGGDPGIPVF